MALLFLEMNKNIPYTLLVQNVPVLWSMFLLYLIILLDCFSFLLHLKPSQNYIYKITHQNILRKPEGRSKIASCFKSSLKTIPLVFPQQQQQQQQQSYRTALSVIVLICPNLFDTHTLKPVLAKSSLW